MLGIVNGRKVVDEIVHDTEFMLVNLPAGATVAVSVAARNHTGESQPCPAVQLVVP